MPIRLPGRRAANRGGALNENERKRIEDWFVAGHTVLEVYSLLLDNGILPPQEKVLYGILNSQSVQQQLKSRRAAEAGSRIAQIAERTRSRNRLLEKIEKTVEARGDAYAELIPGGEYGLVVHSDRKSSMVGKDEDGPILVHFDVFKTDGAMIEAWDRVLSSQEKSDQALRRNMREIQCGEHEAAMRDLERQRLELEVQALRAKIQEMEAEQLRQSKAAYQPPTFPEVILEKLPDPVRPASLDVPDTEEDEAAVPEIPWILEGLEKPGPQEAATEVQE